MAHADINSSDRRKRWRARNVEKDAAHRAVENFVRSLKTRGLPLPTCQVTEPHECTGKIHAHHTDYSRPLDVIWMCDSWHITQHWENNWRAERANGKRVIYHTRVTVIEEK